MIKLVDIKGYLENKELIKKLAKEIKEERKLYKQEQRLNKIAFDSYLKSLVWEYRHYHIAMSLFRGKALEDIETPKDNNKPSVDYYTRILNDLIQEKANAEQSAICSDQIRPE